MYSMRAIWMLFGWMAFCSASGFRVELDGMWKVFKQTHHKNYESSTEEEYRRYIWEQNVAFIQQHNLEYDLGFHTFTVGINQYSDWSPKEYATYLNGFHPMKSKSTKMWSDMEPSIQQLPDTVDWRDKGYVTPVKNQGRCGSCWAFSATGSLEGQHFRRTGKLVSLSEQNIVDCDKRSGGCRGGATSLAFNYIKANKGIDTEACYPYKAKNDVCTFNSSCIGSTCSGHVSIPNGNETALKVAVATQGPISVAIDANHKSFFHYKTGVLVEPNCTMHIDHAVLVVGYGTENGQDYWLVKNSWGAGWGIKGYIKMARNHGNMCAIASHGIYPLV